MWITKLLVLKIDKYDKKIMDEISDETILDKDVFKKAFLVGCLEGIVDGCLIVGAIQTVKTITGTIKWIIKK